MSKFELPSLESISNDEPEVNDDSSVFNHPDTDESLIDFNDPYEDENEDIQDDMFGESDFEDDDTVAKFKELKGQIIAIKVNEETSSTAMQLQTNSEGLVYLQEEEVNFLVEKGMQVNAIVDTENTGTTRSGIKVYQTIEVIPTDSQPVSNDTESEPTSKSKSKKRSKSPLGDKIKNAIKEVKMELKGNGDSPSRNSSDDDHEGQEDDVSDDYQDEPGDNKKNKSRRKRRKNPVVLMYVTIADFLLSLIMGIVNILSSIPLIGKLFALIKILEPLFKLITRLWLPLLIALVILLGRGISLKDIPDNGKSDETLIAKGDSKIAVSNEVYSEGNVTLTGTNKGDTYADFYFTAEVNEDKTIPFLGKSTKCISEYSVLGIDESRTYILKCDDNLSKAKIKNIDIVLDN